MTVVIADTSPVNYLVLIREIAILPKLYGQVLIPPEVLAKLSDAATPPGVLLWIRSQPTWLQTREVRSTHDDLTLRQLDPGERAAILLAEQEAGALLLMEVSGRLCKRGL